MIDKTTDFFDDLAKGVGLTVKMPRPKKKTRIAAAMINGAVGIGLVAAGAAISSKALIGVGAIGLTGAVALGLKR